MTVPGTVPAPADTDTTGAELIEALDEAIREHERKLDGIALWIGAEPTFTDRFSEAPEWLHKALGADKEARARRLTRLLAERHPGAAVMRSIGRPYPNEPEPRWCYGLYASRDGTPVWTGPADRLCDGAADGPVPELVTRFHHLLHGALIGAGWFAEVVPANDGPLRLWCRSDGVAPSHDARRDAQLLRPSVHGVRIEGAGPVDELAPSGDYLILCHAGGGQPDANELWLELPAFSTVAEFRSFLGVAAEAANSAGVQALGLRGFTPPVDDSVAWTTLTPDPAVLEVNQAPSTDLASFHLGGRELYRMAEAVGLVPYRLQYNGSVTDSGGGGQLTFGGPSPAESPFFVYPWLLPRLIRYLIQHPALSYWFATRYVGGSSQSPRPDESTRSAFLELQVGLELLAREPAPSPALLWGTLRHFLADATGNPHRSELNIEKLDNPFLPRRGQLGLVEMRALAMAQHPTFSTARALLLRSVLAMLIRADVAPELVDFGDVLHDRFALPFYLLRDLQRVFADLEHAGLGIHPLVADLLATREDGLLAELKFAGCTLRVDTALEFWPLLGDVTEHGGGSRLVDASTARIELRLTARDALTLDALQLSVNGQLVPLRVEHDGDHAVRVFGVRYRTFKPNAGLHPSLPPEERIVLTLQTQGERALRVALHAWRPDGSAYPGLPTDFQDARARRLERAVIEEVSVSALPIARTPPASALTAHCLDLRRVPAAS
jgi:uncharacterized protein (DUF2126 family)